MSTETLAPTASSTPTTYCLSQSEPSRPLHELDRLYAQYRADRTQIDPLLSAVRNYAVKFARAFEIADPEDAAQDALLKVWSSMAAFDGSSSFRAWVHRIVRNTAIDSKRTGRSLRCEQVDELPEPERERYGASGIDLQTLPERTRRMAEMLRAGYSQEEIARQLNISRSTVARTFARLKRELGV